MKKILLATAMSLAATSAFAEIKYATITSVQPNYQTVYQDVPRTHCQDVQVPIYGRTGGGATGGDVLAGIIIGGILGKGVTGNDKGAAAGAIAGGVIAADNKNQQVVTGYQTQRQCSEVISREKVQTLKNYRIEFQWRNARGSAYTYNTYNVGDQIPVEVSIRAK